MKGTYTVPQVTISIHPDGTTLEREGEKPEVLLPTDINVTIELRDGSRKNVDIEVLIAQWVRKFDHTGM